MMDEINLEFKTVITKKDTIKQATRPMRFLTIAGVVLTVVFIICLFVPIEMLQELSITMIGLGIFFATFGLLFPLIFKVTLKSLPDETVYNYTFSDKIYVHAIINSVENNISFEYSAINKVKLKKDTYYLYVSKFIFYPIKVSSFNSEEEKVLFLNKFENKN